MPSKSLNATLICQILGQSADSLYSTDELQVIAGKIAAENLEIKGILQQGDKEKLLNGDPELIETLNKAREDNKWTSDMHLILNLAYYSFNNESLDEDQLKLLYGIGADQIGDVKQQFAICKLKFPMTRLYELHATGKAVGVPLKSGVFSYTTDSGARELPFFSHSSNVDVDKDHRVIHGNLDNVRVNLITFGENLYVDYRSCCNLGDLKVKRKDDDSPLMARDLHGRGIEMLLDKYADIKKLPGESDNAPERDNLRALNAYFAQSQNILGLTIPVQFSGANGVRVAPLMAVKNGERADPQLVNAPAQALRQEELVARLSSDRTRNVIGMAMQRMEKGQPGDVLLYDH